MFAEDRMFNASCARVCVRVVMVVMADDVYAEAKRNR